MLRASGLAVLLGFVGATVSAVAQENLTLIPKWSRFQGELVSLKPYDNPVQDVQLKAEFTPCLLYTSPSPRDATLSRMPSSA